MSTPDVNLLALLAYRMGAISIGHMALRHQMSWDVAPSMEVYFNGKLVIDGRATGFTNPAIESAIIHCRAILEFLGLKSSKASSTGIAERSRRTNQDDCGVENFAGLSMLTKTKALAAYPGEQLEAEAALALIFHSANKGLAHTTASFERHSGEARLLAIAFRGVPTLLVNGFYLPLNIAPPNHELTSRPRAE
ncbi:hypothetical protein [Roseateles albus]|uniref:Uncharacterized protein n=1 Tax=Roseateles albus TaxID=2987525 RepID=A0ABT5KEX7_9BURK|nr:hypothetical protein [Roseateles albus]MDC8772375.1 hypothetical protein [Roseateles albus]